MVRWETVLEGAPSSLIFSVGVCWCVQSTLLRNAQKYPAEKHHPFFIFYSERERTFKKKLRDLNFKNFLENDQQLVQLAVWKTFLVFSQRGSWRIHFQSFDNYYSFIEFHLYIHWSIQNNWHKNGITVIVLVTFLTAWESDFDIFDTGLVNLDFDGLVTQIKILTFATLVTIYESSDLTPVFRRFFRRFRLWEKSRQRGKAKSNQFVRETLGATTKAILIIPF